MTWGELLARIDAARNECHNSEDGILLRDLRIELRVMHGNGLNNNIPDNSDFAQRVMEVSMPYYREPEPQKPLLDELFACIPEEPGQIQGIVDRGDGEGRMVVMRRDTPLIVREPDLVEVEEKDLAK